MTDLTLDDRHNLAGHGGPDDSGPRAPHRADQGVPACPSRSLPCRIIRIGTSTGSPQRT
jgi:hypothetical protein